MNAVTLEIPGEMAQAMRLPPPERESRLRLESAVALYAQSILALGKAAELADCSLLRFEDELTRRHVRMHCDETDLAPDIAYACGRQ